MHSWKLRCTFTHHEGATHEKSWSYFSYGCPSAICLSNICFQRCKERDMEKWQSCSIQPSQAEQHWELEIPLQDLSYLVWNLLFNRPSLFSWKSGMCLKTSWQHTRLHIILMFLFIIVVPRKPKFSPRHHSSSCTNAEKKVSPKFLQYSVEAQQVSKDRGEHTRKQGKNNSASYVNEITNGTLV